MRGMISLFRILTDHTNRCILHPILALTSLKALDERVVKLENENGNIFLVVN